MVSLLEARGAKGACGSRMDPERGGRMPHSRREPHTPATSRSPCRSPGTARSPDVSHQGPHLVMVGSPALPDACP